MVSKIVEKLLRAIEKQKQVRQCDLPHQKPSKVNLEIDFGDVVIFVRQSAN